MASTTEQVSKVVLRDTTVPDGIHDVFACEYPDIDLAVSDAVEFKDGTGELSVNVSPNRRILAMAVTKDTFPPTDGAVISAATEGSLRVYANETLKVEPGFFTNIVYLAGKFKTGKSLGVITPSGAFVSSEGSYNTIQYSPNGAFDDLDPGETASEEIKFFNDEVIYTDPSWDYTDRLVGAAWTDLGGESYSRSGGNASILNFYGSSEIIPGSAMKITGSATGGTGGVLYIYLVQSIEGDVVPTRLALAGEVVFNSGDFEFTVEVPDGCDGIQFTGSSSFDGAISNLALSSVDEDAAGSATVTIIASEDVGPKLVTQDGYGGTSWSQSGTSYTKAAGDTNPLTAELSLVESKIYEISMTVSGRTAGSIKPQLVGDTTNLSDNDYVLADNERDVWYIRAPANCTGIEIVPTSDFDGIVSRVNLRELLRDSNVAVARKIETSSGATGELTIEPIFSASEGYPSEFDSIFTGELDNGDGEFGVRITTPSTYKVEDAYATAKRSAVSTKGGSYCVVDNLTVTGGYDEQAASGKFQTAYVGSDNEPVMYTSWLYNLRSDGLQTVQDGTYKRNSDHIVLNANINRDGYKAKSYIFNSHARQWSDGMVDSKMTTFNMHSNYEGGWRTVRFHDVTSELIYCCKINTVADSQSALHIKQCNSRALLFQTTINGYRAVSVSQLQGVAKAIAMDTDDNSSEENYLTIQIMKTFPRIPAEGRVNMTNMDVQIQYNQTGEWVDVDAEYPIFFSDSLVRTLSGLPSGTHNLRVRAVNGEHVGIWYTEIGVTVL